jgi:hypothetical protein
MDEQNTKTEEVPKTATKPKYIQFLLPGAILLAALIISGTLIFARGQSSSDTAKPVDIKINLPISAVHIVKSSIRKLKSR